MMERTTRGTATPTPILAPVEIPGEWLAGEVDAALLVVDDDVAPLVLDDVVLGKSDDCHRISIIGATSVTALNDVVTVNVVT